MSRYNQKLVWIDVEIRAMTSAAVQVSNGSETAWLPLSQIEDYEDELQSGVHTRIEIPEWLATEKDLI